LGVVDVAYSQKEANGTTKRTTTGDVAEILEKTYAVMQTFFEVREVKIAGFLADSIANAIQDRVSGRRGGSPTVEAEQKIEAEFRAFLDANEMQNRMLAMGGDQLISMAALRGVSHRKKHPYAKANPSRPMFIDSGLFRISFRAVVNL
jgi:hypothetical protein